MEYDISMWNVIELFQPIELQYCLVMKYTDNQM